MQYVKKENGAPEPCVDVAYALSLGYRLCDPPKQPTINIPVDIPAIEPTPQAIEVASIETEEMLPESDVTAISTCSKNHEWTPENTYWRGDGKGRCCRTCRREMNRKVKAQKRGK